MKKNKSICFQVYDPLYQRKLIFVSCNKTNKTLNALLKKVDILEGVTDLDFFTEEDYDTNGFRTSLENKAKGIYVDIIWCDINRKDYLRIISHEVVHFVFSCFNRLGIPTNKENDESFAYYYDFILDQILWKIQKIVSRRKKCQKSTKKRLNTAEEKSLE